ncbi:MAG: sodium:proton antiporter, partial [Bacteroidia bacterium]|nr:sodium:proton antiporter [Bacteroidia bacterium]
MKKILSFSLFLIIGLALSQFLPALGENYNTVKMVSDTLLYICLAYI